MRKSNMVAFAILAAFLLSACSPTKFVRGNLIRESVLAQVKAGETNRAEVLQAFGSPTTSRSFDDSVWYYIGQKRERTTFLPSEIKAIEVYVLKFDENNILQNIDSYDRNSLRQLSYNERRTPTRGSELTMLQQLLGNFGRFEADQARGSVADLLE